MHIVFWILVAILPGGQVKLWSKPFPTEQVCRDTQKEVQARMPQAKMYCLQNAAPRQEG